MLSGCSARVCSWQARWADVSVIMKANARKPILTNAEGFEIPQPSSRRDRWTHFLVALLQLIAVGIILRQLKQLGFLPDWVNTDLTTVRPLSRPRAGCPCHK